MMVRQEEASGQPAVAAGPRWGVGEGNAELERYQGRMVPKTLRKAHLGCGKEDIFPLRVWANKLLKLDMDDQLSETRAVFSLWVTKSV